MSNFQWQTDAEDDWEEKIVVTPPPKPPRLRRYGWLVVLVVALASAAGLLYWRAHQQVEAATTAVTNDVISSHNLLQRAIFEQDEDLFTAVLSGRDPDWTKAQQALLRIGSAQHRPSFGLQAITTVPPTFEETEHAIESVDFAADLLSAELVSRQTYTATMPDGRVEFITLRQTAVYRRGDNRWLYAPPDSEFWDTTVTDDSRDLTIVYPKRDEELVRQLIVDLERLLAEMCQTLPDLNCPDNLNVTLVLSTDPDSLVNLNEPRTLWEGGLRVVLPTPTLVGLPVNDVAYDILFQGYARQVATAVITHLVQWECCMGAPFYQALLDYQLAQLNLFPWPVTRADYQRIATENVSLDELGNYWRVDSPYDVPADKHWLVYVTADFVLQTDPNLSATSVQRSMDNWNSLYTWLENYILGEPDGLPNATTNIDQRWHAVAEVQRRLTDTLPPVPLPTQDIQLLCYALTDEDDVFTMDSATLYRYRLAEDEWVEELTLNDYDYALMSAMPGDQAVLMQALDFDDTNLSYFFVWQDSKPRQRVQIADDYTLSFGQFLPGNDRVIAYTFNEEVEAPLAHIIDLTQCDENTCASQPVLGLQSASPSGNQFIVAEPIPNNFTNIVMEDGRSLFLNNRFDDQPPFELFRTSNAAERVYIGDGFDSFWVDEETYGYLRPTTENTLEVVIAKTADDIPQPLFDSKYLSEQAPGVLTRLSFSINYILVSPHYPDQLFIVTTSLGRSTNSVAYIFSYSLSSHQLSLRVQTPYVGTLSLGFSPDGRYLVVNGWREGSSPSSGGFSSMILYDLNTGSRDSYLTAFPDIFPSYLYDWSADGQWLAIIVDEHTIALTQPEQAYYQIIKFDFEFCTSMAWINS